MTETDDMVAHRMEKPIFRLYQGPGSPIIMSWFRLESPRTEDVVIDTEEEGNDKVNGERREGQEEI